MTYLSKLLSRDVFPDPVAALPAQSSLTSLTAGMISSLGRRSSTRCSGILDDVRTSSRIPEHLVELLLLRLALMPAVRLVKELCAGRAAKGQETRPVTKACCQMSWHDLNGQCHHTFFSRGGLLCPWQDQACGHEAVQVLLTSRDL